MEIFIIVIITLAIFAALGSSSSSSSSIPESSTDYEGPPPFKYRKKIEKLGEFDDEIVIIENKGMFPISRAMNIGFSTSIFDITDGGDNKMPILSFLSDMQEKDSTIFQHIVPVGRVEPYAGFTKWVKVGGIVLDALQPPYGGERKLQILTRLIDMDDQPILDYGFMTGLGGDSLHLSRMYYTHNFTQKGYKEISKIREEARVNAINLSMAVAFSDGVFEDAEGQIIRNWIKDKLEHLDGERREELKNVYNNAMKNSYEEAKKGNLYVKEFTDNLNKIDLMPQKIEAMELCFKVMAADGVAEKGEMKLLHELSEKLDLDWKEIEKLRDESIITLDTKDYSKGNAEDLLGIDSSWSEEEKKVYLTKEFQKWNDRLSTLEEGSARENAQSMLDLIAQSRKLYD